MAKGQVPKDDNREIKKLLQQLFGAVKGMAEAGQELHTVNRDLLKVMSLLNSGFVDNADDAKKLIKSIQEDGFYITDEFTKKWAKARKLTDEDLKKIIDKFKEIEKVGDDVIDNATDYTDLLEEQLTSIEKNLDLSTKLLKGHREITEALSASRKQAEILGGTTEQVNNITQKLLQKKVDLAGMFGSMFDGVSKGQELISNIQSDIDSLIQRAGDSNIEVGFKFNILTDDVDKEVKKILDSIDEEKANRLKGLNEYYSKNLDLQDKLAKQIASQKYTTDVKFDINTEDITTSAGVLSKGTSEYEKVLNRLTKIISDNNVASTVNDNLKDMVNLMGMGANLTDEQNDKLIKYTSLLDDANKIIFQQFHLKQSDLNLLEESILTEKSRLTLIGKYTDKLSAARTIVEKIGSGFDYIDEILPSGVSDFLGISKVSLSLLEAHTKGVEKFTSYIKEGGDLTNSMSVYMAELGPSIKNALNPMTLLVAAGAMLFQTLRNTVDAYKDVSSELKISIKQAKQLFNVQLDTLTSQKNQFATMDDIRQIQTEMIASGRSLNSLTTKGSKELAINLSDTSKAFGYGSEQAAKLQNVFRDLGADDTLALNLQTNLGFMSEMVGLSPQIISNDLLDASETMYTYFAGMPDKAAKTALQVRRMGLSLQQAGKIAGNMLDLESFMTNMYELQAMSGGGVDFSSAFDKGLVGDIEGMTKDIMNEIGTTAEFSKMDFLTRKKIANTLGMSVDELGKSVQLNEQISMFTGDIKTQLEANIDRMGDISKLNQDEIRDRLKQLQSTDRLGVAWDKIKGVLLKALIPLAESFADAIDAISPIIDIIIGGLKGVGFIIKIIAPLVKGMLAPFKFIGNILSGITGYLDGWGDTLKPINTTITFFGHKFDLVKDTIYAIGGAIGTWTMLFKLPSILGGVLDVFKGMLSFIPGIGTIFKSITGGFDGIFGSMGKKSKEAAQESTDPVVNMTTKIHDSMVGMINGIKSSMDGMVSHIKNSMSEAGSSIKRGFTISPTEKLMKEVKSNSSNIGEVITSNVQTGMDGANKAIFKGVKKSKKDFKDLKNDTSNLIPVAPIKKSFGLLTQVGTKSIAMLAAKSATSFLFAQKEGDQHLSGISAEIQSMIELAAMGGSAILVDTLSEGFQDVVTEKLEKKMDKGFHNVGKSLTSKMSRASDVGKKVFEKMTGGINNSLDTTESKTKGLFAKVGEYGKSAYDKLKTIGKSLLQKEKINGGDILDTVKKTVENKDIVKSDKVKSIKPDKIKLPKAEKLEPINVDLPSKSKKSVSNIGSIFENVSKVIRKAWGGIKSILLDVVKFAGNVLKSISEAVGKSVESLLKGIGKGLSSFKTDAIKGAAALVLVSGALWITSKALENFANISWESISKGILTLGALSVAGIMLGKMSGQLIEGALAIGILGASLIPAAYALKMFNDVEWESLGKAAAALIGLGVVGTLLSGLAPELIIGAAGLALFSGALIITGIALEKFNDIGWESLGKAAAALVGFGLAASAFGLASPFILAGAIVLGAASVSLIMFAGSVVAINTSMENLDVKPFKDLTQSLVELTSISVMSLLGIATGITAVSASIATLTLVGIGNKVTSLFGGNVIDDLQDLAEMADPLNTVNQIISSLSNSILELSEIISTANFESISKLNDIDVKSLDQDVTQKINQVTGMAQNYNQPSINYKVSPVQTQVADVKPPKPSQVAQNVSINKLPGSKQDGAEQGGVAESNNSVQNSYYNENSGDYDIYNRPGIDTKKIEMLLMRLIQLNEQQLQKNQDISIDGRKVTDVIKKNFNNK